MISNTLELLALTKKYSENFILQFEESGKYTTKIKQLYLYLSKPTKDPINANEIAKQLNYKGIQDKGFKLLCSRLEDKILSALILIDYKHNSSAVRKKTFEINKRYLQGQMLLTNSKRSLGIKLLEKALKDALHYEQTHLALSILEKLNSHYAFLSRNDSKWKKYTDLKKDMMSNLKAEHEAENMYNELSHYAVFKSKSDAEYLSKISNEFSKVLSVGQEKTKTFRYNELAYQIRQYNLNLQGKYQDSVNLCNEAIDFLRQKPFFNRSTYVVFSTSKIEAFLNLGMFSETITEIEGLYEHLTPLTHNWFKTQRKLFFVYSMTNNYKEMYRLTSKMSNPKLYKANKSFEENWKIREAYIHFLIKAGKVKAEEDFPMKPFRLGRFLNEVPQYSKDKEGVNTSILIIQILFFIADGRLDKIEEKLDSLNKYCHRYLRNDETFRFNCFIKMLLKLPEAEYNPIRTNRYVKKYYERLIQFPREKTIETFSAEVIDFEELWNIIIDILPSKGYKARYQH